MRNFIIDIGSSFKVGDPCPTGYNDRIAWAQVHMDAGLKQERCGHCSLWFWPHELHPETRSFMASRIKHGPANVKVEYRVCLTCHEKGEK